MKASSVLFVTTLLAAMLPGLKARAQTATQLYAAGSHCYEEGNVDEAKRELNLALEVDRNFRPAANLLARIADDQRKAGPGAERPGLQRKTLEALTFPVEFKDTTLESAVEFLRQRVEAVSGGKAKVSFVMNIPPEVAQRRVTLHLEHVPFLETLRYVGELAGVSFQLEQYAIRVVPAAAPPAAS